MTRAQGSNGGFVDAGRSWPEYRIEAMHIIRSRIYPVFCVSSILILRSTSFSRSVKRPD